MLSSGETMGSFAVRSLKARELPERLCRAIWAEAGIVMDVLHCCARDGTQKCKEQVEMQASLKPLSFSQCVPFSSQDFTRPTCARQARGRQRLHVQAGTVVSGLLSFWSLSCSHERGWDA